MNHDLFHLEYGFMNYTEVVVQNKTKHPWAP